ncbi:MAG: hypothetical protein IJU41_01030 [Clostridia bacterium]|nr:hypothetical protein [Clostridia bacterium]
MGKFLRELADKKWFVPAVLFLMALILLSSFFEKGSGGDIQLSESEENRLATLCDRLLGTTSTSVMFSYGDVSADAFFGGEKRRAVCGVAILCEGGDDPAVQLKLYRLIKSLYSISGDQISICGYG